MIQPVEFQKKSRILCYKIAQIKPNLTQIQVFKHEFNFKVFHLQF